MSGLSKKTEGGSVKFLTIHGDSIWQKLSVKAINEGKRGEDTEEFLNKDKVTQIRSGEKWGELTGTISKIEFVDGKFGQSMQVEVMAGGEKYILTTGAGSPHAKKLYIMFFKMDLAKPVTIKPYDFNNTDDNGKEWHNVGISASQEGVKLELKGDLEGAPLKEGESGKKWFADQKKAGGRGTDKIKAYYQEIVYFCIDEITAKIIPNLGVTVTETTADDYAQPEESEDDMPF